MVVYEIINVYLIKGIKKLNNKIIYNLWSSRYKTYYVLLKDIKYENN